MGKYFLVRKLVLVDDAKRNNTFQGNKIFPPQLLKIYKSCQASQLLEGSQCTWTHRHQPCTSPATRMPEGKVSSTQWAEMNMSRRRSARLSAEPALANVKTKLKNAAGKDKSADKNKQKVAKGEQRGNRLTRNKEDLPAENRESPASNEAGGKEAKSD